MVTRGKQEQSVQPDRLTLKTRKRCDSQNSDRKTERQPEAGARHISVVSKVKLQPESNRVIDARIDFYGQYIQLNEQVTLQSQDPKKNGVYKLSLIDLEAYGVS